MPRLRLRNRDVANGDGACPVSTLILPTMRVFHCAAILFDVDGVLVSSTGSVERVWRQWANEHGLDAEAVIAAAHGRRTIETVREFMPHLDPQKETSKVEQMEIADTAGLAALPGARAALESAPP